MGAGKLNMVLATSSFTLEPSCSAIVFILSEMLLTSRTGVLLLLIKESILLPSFWVLSGTCSSDGLSCRCS